LLDGKVRGWWGGCPELVRGGRGGIGGEEVIEKILGEGGGEDRGVCLGYKSSVTVRWRYWPRVVVVRVWGGLSVVCAQRKVPKAPGGHQEVKTEDQWQSPQ